MNYIDLIGLIICCFLLIIGFYQDWRDKKKHEKRFLEYLKQKEKDHEKKK